MIRVQRVALAIGAALLLLTILGGLWGPENFFRSYLLGFLFCWNIAIGSLGILMIHNLTGGAWGVAIRRPLEAATYSTPILALMMIPMLLCQHELWWSANGMPAAIPAHQRLYLSEPLFLTRQVVYFFIWILFSFRLKRSLSGPGLVILVLTVTFASIDWLLALEPGWFSTIFGLRAVAGQGLSALCFATAVVILLRRSGALGDLVKPRHILDLGKLILAFVMLWGYMAFSQLLIIWSGNLPPQINWYDRRFHGGWQYLGITLIVGHLLLPLFLLLFRGLRRRGLPFLALLAFLLTMRLCDAFWLTAPEYYGHFTVSWMTFLVPAGLIAVWLSYFLYQLRRRPLLPRADLDALGGGDATAS